jgi:hypothetical protein
LRREIAWMFRLDLAVSFILPLGAFERRRLVQNEVLPRRLGLFYKISDKSISVVGGAISTA